MALKFLNKKGWHTGSLRNIENVWKAEQKHDAEQKKLEELRKQIQEERERSEFRLLQEQAGLVPKQERLDFLYDSGLAVGKGSSDGFKALESFPKTDPEIASSSTKQQQPSVPGALFEEKPQSANDAWRKLHSDPLLLIRQREQEALARVKNNPIQMAMIRKSVEAKKQKEKTSDGKKHGEKHHHKKLKHQKRATTRTEEKKNHSYTKSSKYKECSNSEDESNERESNERDIGSKKNSDKDLMYKKLLPSALPDPIQKNVRTRRGRYDGEYQCERSRPEESMNSESAKRVREDGKQHPSSPCKSPDMASRREPRHKHQNKSSKLSEEERAARLQEMQMDAELHEEQRWKRLRKAEEDDAKEATRAGMSSGRNFLDAAHKSVYGAEKGGSSTIEESVRRRTHYSQRRSQVGEGNAFRR